jgi:hypothetical protein
MPRDPFVREKFTKDRNAARKHAAEYFQRFPKERYQTEVESWRHLQSQNIEFTMKRLREPIESDGRPRVEASAGFQRLLSPAVEASTIAA